jgi:UDP-3-O-[3-hydroxymyristoyl] glucosamine N-acyltransferase
VQALHRFFVAEPPPAIHPTALIDPQAVLEQGVSVGAYSRVGPEVVLGDSCVIGSGVSLEGPVLLGARCRIKANSVIGGYGFGFEYDDDGTPLHFPHVGRIVLENDVWLGACTTVERATLGETRLCRGVKVDDLVQIGHNCCVGANTLVMANAVLCGGVVVGSRCWIAPNSVVKQKVRLGDRVTVGLGAVVLRDVASDAVVAGVPAKPLQKG